MHDTLLMVFTGILAAAVLMQSILFIGMYRSLRQMVGMRKELFGDILSILNRVGEAAATIKRLADGVKPIEDKIYDTVDIVHKRIVNLDKFLAEATDTARLEIIRIQDTIQTASHRAEETMELLRSSFLAPINEINAITRAIRVTLDILFRRRKSPSVTSVQDEEMFI